jgi:hypothetical protein
MFEVEEVRTVGKHVVECSDTFRMFNSKQKDM